MGSRKSLVWMGAGAAVVAAAAVYGYVCLSRTIPQEIRALPWAAQVRGVELEDVSPSWTHGVYAVYRIEGDGEISRVYWRWKGNRFECEM